MHPPDIDIAYLIENGYAWTVTEDTVLVDLYNVHTQRNQQQQVSLTAVAAYDPRLPIALRVLQAQSEMKGKRGIYGSHVRNTLSFWKVPRFIDAVDGTRYAVGSVFNLQLSEHVTGKQAAVDCLRFPYHQVARDSEGTTEIITVCSDSSPTRIMVAQLWLDEHYPDWQTRWSVATELGLTTEDRARYTLDRPPQFTPVALPDALLIGDAT